MARQFQDFAEFGWQVCDRVGVSLNPHFLKAEAGFAQRRRGGTVYVFAYNREGTPHSEAFECQNNLCTAFALYTGNELEVTAQAGFLEDKAGRWIFHVLESDQRWRRLSGTDFTGSRTSGAFSTSTESESSPNQFFGEETQPFTVR